jgi:[ribosomal protein S5]-alanine N-acetyltransferase
MRIGATKRWSDEVVELFLLEPEHVSPAYVSWLNDPQMNRYLESRFSRHDEQSTRAFVKSCLENPETLFLGVRQLETGRHVGNIKLEINRSHRRAEVGILIGDPAVQGRGIGTRAIKRVADIARSELSLRRLTAGCYASNMGSERAFLKAGFAIEGTRPEFFLVSGRPESMTLMGCALDQ